MVLQSQSALPRAVLIPFMVLIGVVPSLGSKASCQQTLNTVSGSLTSPNFPDKYPNKARCTWLIKAPPGHVVHLRIKSFDLEDTANCNGDSVHLYDGESERAKLLGRPYCGNKAPLLISSSRNSLLIVFTSDFAVQRNGFQMEYTTAPGCTRTIRSDSGVIRSPHYPKPYPSNANCSFQIVAGKNRRIKLTFTDIDIEAPPAATVTCYDYVSVYDVVQDNPVHLKTLCGKPSPGSLYSTTNKMQLFFISDASHEKRGFEARFTSHSIVCKKNEFSCWNGRCVSLTQVCDGTNNCGDNTDEASCQCQSDQWKCANGRCIPDNFVCNGINDCLDGGDERNCSRRNVTTNCGLSLKGCKLTCSYIGKTQSCLCSDGYRYVPSLAKCEDVDECQHENGGCHERCINFPGGYKCGCERSGFQVRNGKCIDIDECATNQHQCHQICINTVGSYRCECFPGYSTTYHDPKRCKDIDECLEGVPGCFGHCINTVGSYYCNCERGFRATEKRTRCRDIDECALGVSGCMHDCKNTLGSYQCSCRGGFQQDLRDQRRCFDVNECRAQNPCQHHCFNTYGSYRCQCQKGYTIVNTTHCVDIDECHDPVKYPCQGKCLNEEGSYKCVCPAGHLLRSDGKCIDANGYEMCGKAKSNGRSKKWKDSSVEAWGWQAFFTATIGRFEMLLDECMGTIISPTLVLTVEHCLRLRNYRVTASNLTVYVNHTVVSSEGVRGHRVSSINYSSDKNGHPGLALIRLADPLGFSEHVHAICVPKRSWGQALDTGKEATLLSWRWFGLKGSASRLQYRKVTLRDPSDCLSHRKVDFGVENIICAEYNGKIKEADCLPASGAPLMVRTLVYYGHVPVKSWTLGGILVHGGGCHGTRTYNAIHSLEQALNWIQYNLKLRS